MLIANIAEGSRKKEDQSWFILDISLFEIFDSVKSGNGKCYSDMGS
ncbi:hypothetical protein [Hydrocoleum sp. CS-953]|nr:hypothetical protein [Hydrocoleum sp. CS-953]